MVSKYTVDGKKIRKAMIDAGIGSYNALSAVSGVCSKTIADIVNNRSNPTYPVMRKLAAALNLSPENAGNIFFG